VPAQNVAVKAVVTPVLIGGASLAGRRFGHHVCGWLVALPMTSGPVAFFLVLDQGASFAAGAAVGMLAATLSQVAFALVYGWASRRGSLRAFGSGAAAFAVATVVFGAVLAVFTHHSHGPGAATQALDGLVLGLLAPAVFFLVLALTLPAAGLLAFVLAPAAALAAQVVSLLAIPHFEPPATG